MPVKLTEKQIALLKAMAADDDGRVVFHPYMGRFNPSDYYHCWALGRCTAQAKVLLKAGLVEKVNVKQIARDHDLVINEAGRKWLAENSESSSDSRSESS